MRRRIPSMGALMAFDATARHASVTRAADELSLTESAISRQISQLESQLEVQLFLRVKKRLSLTQAGVAYARDVGKVLERLERDTLDVMTNEGEGGALEIAVCPTVCKLWLIPRLPDFYESHPKLTMSISARNNRFLFRGTTFDGALFYGAASWPGARSDFLFDRELIAVVGGRLLQDPAPWTPERIAQERLLHLVTRLDSWRDWAESAGVEGLNMLKGPRFDMQLMAIEAACAGLGVALVPRFMVAADLQEGRLRIVSDISLREEGAYYFSYPEEKAGEPQLEFFRSWLQVQAQRFRGPDAAGPQ
ncbi:MAG: LysR substrate-binding domain-containing protein [Polaromonas sp.]|nr:LysR substrate-binding domain-containing protein [Polaromonas sp.]